MTAYIVDTSAYSLALRGHADAEDEMRAARRLVVPVIAVGELLQGFRGGVRERENRALLREFLGPRRVEIAPVDEQTAEHYAAIMHGLRTAGRPLPTNDVWIAGTALQHDLPILTADRHFTLIPEITVRLLDLPGGDDV